MRLLNAICIELVLNDLLLEHSVTELELVDAVYEVFLADEPTVADPARANHRCAAHLAVFDNFFQPEDFIQTNQVQAKLLRTRGHFKID
jgi:hypothetical protein